MRGMFASNQYGNGTGLDIKNLQQPEQKKPKFFSRDGAGVRIAGALGDAFLQNLGHRPIYAQRLDQNAQQQQQEQNRLIEQQQYKQKREDDFLDYQRKYEFERNNPKASSPTSLQSNYEYLKSINPTQAEQFLKNQTTAPPLVITNSDGTKTVYPAGQIPRGGAAPTGPVGKLTPVGGGGSNVTNGFR